MKPKRQQPDPDDCEAGEDDESLLDYDQLADAYLDAVARIEMLEEYAIRMLQISGGLRKLKP